MHEKTSGSSEERRGTAAAFRGLMTALAADARNLLIGVRLGARRILRRSRRSRRKVAPATIETPDATQNGRARLGFVSVFFAAVALTVSAFAILSIWALRDVPWNEIAAGTAEPVIVLEDGEGGPLVTAGAYRGTYTRVDGFPGHLVDAVLAIEDRRFHSHAGLDLRGIGRAAFRNLWSGGVVEGGSTITQQLVKISYLERHRTFRRKIQEAVVALWLDERLGKEEILTRYLNRIYLGAGATGVPAAARIYFDKEPQDLDLAESAMIAGLIRAPSQLNPLTNPEGAGNRAAVVLRAMVETGAISPEEAEIAGSSVAELRPTRAASSAGSWFADWAMEEGREIAGGFGGPVTVRTTFRSSMQKMAEEAVAATLAEKGLEDSELEAAMVVMRPDGAVLAMVGGRDYAKSTFNRAVQARRQPGSTFKLFVYHAAIRAGIPMNARIEDGPVEIGGWSPENFGGGYRGVVTLAEAFARSLNAATVKLAMEVGIDNVAKSARDLGIEAPLTETPSLALGTSEVSLVDITGAYASVRAGRAPVEPYAVESFVVGSEGRAFRAGPPRRPSIDLSAEQGDLVALLGTAVERGTGRAARLDRPAAGKTGTSQNYRDAWFIGFTEELVAGVWIGRDDNAPMPEITGGSLPAEIWKRFMDMAAQGRQPEETSPADDAPSASPGLVADSATQPACNVRACQRAYRSFRASDCTFQPYRGPRRMCER